MTQARIIVTGGTFDKHYDAIKGELTFKETHLPAILEQARVTLPVAIEINQLVGKAALGKTVVFTGAMIPYAIQGSDALFNLGFALAMAQALDPGAYVAMNGRVFAWDNVRKDKVGGVFQHAR